MSSVIGLEQSCIKRDLHVQSAVPGRVRYDVRRILWRQPSLAERGAEIIGAAARHQCYSKSADRPHTRVLRFVS
jgi:hypothetical protein